jgi:KDO2-lipid IV(A) lauroyltransferase
MRFFDSLVAATAAFFLRVLGALPPAAASNYAGWVARIVGPLLPVSRVARKNLQAAMPSLGFYAHEKIVRDVWESLGRTVGEFPHLGRLAENTPSGPGWEVEGVEHLAALAARGGPAIFFSGHIGNWEILPRASAVHGLPCANFYRAASNAGVDALIRRLRQQAAGKEEAAQKMPFFPKGRAGARQALMHLKGGGFLAMLVDQKMNDGIEARFFGLPAMTAPAAASLALHFRCPLVPAMVQRVGPARFRLMVEAPLALPASGDRALDVQVLTQCVNDVLERWIRASPGAWLWLHRRWPKHIVKS